MISIHLVSPQKSHLEAMDTYIYISKIVKLFKNSFNLLSYSLIDSWYDFYADVDDLKPLNMQEAVVMRYKLIN